MKEKDIKKQLNKELEAMAPDLLNKICAVPIEPVESEEELFGNNEKLFERKRKIVKFVCIPIGIAAIACILLAVMIVRPQLVPTSTGTAFQVIIDVNPSIKINVNKDGTANSITAGNKDAKPVVAMVEDNFKNGDSYDKVVNMVMEALKNQGYTNKKKNAILISIVSSDKKDGAEKLSQVKNSTKTYEKQNKIKCATVYQSFAKTKKIEKVAKKNSISIGKAAFCIKLAEKEKVSVSKICKNSIYLLVQTAEKHISSDFIDTDVEVDYGYEEESETETIFETENVPTTVSEETTVDIESSTTAEQAVDETTKSQVKTSTKAPSNVDNKEPQNNVADKPTGEQVAN